MENDYFWAAVKQRAMIEMDRLISELTTASNTMALERLRTTVIELLEIAETKKSRDSAGVEAAAVELEEIHRVRQCIGKIQSVSQIKETLPESNQRGRPQDVMKRRDEEGTFELNQSSNSLMERENLQSEISQPTLQNLEAITAQYSHLAEVNSENKQAMAKGLKSIQTHISKTNNSLNALKKESGALRMKLNGFGKMLQANQRLTNQNKSLQEQLDIAKTDLAKSQLETQQRVSDLESLRLALDLPLSSEGMDLSEDIPMIYTMREEIAALRESSQLLNPQDHLGTNNYSNSAGEAFLMGEGEALKTTLLAIMELVPDESYPTPWIESVFIAAFIMQSLKQDILSGKNTLQKFREMDFETQGSWFCLTSIFHASGTFTSDNTIGCMECRQQNRSSPCVQIRMQEGTVYFRGTVIRGGFVEQMHD